MTETSKPVPLPPSRWRHLRRGLLLLSGLWLLVCSLLWGVAPQLLQSAAADWAQQHGRRLRLDDIAINPFTLRLDVGRIALDEGNGTPLLHAAGLTVNAEAWPLLLGRWQLSELTLRQPQLQLERNARGVWNWARFVADVSGPAATPAPQPQPLPRLLLEQVTLSDGQLKLRDHLAGDTALRALPLSVHLQQLSTLPQPGGYTLSARLDDGSKLDWRGELQLQPLQSHGLLRVTGFSPASIWGYIRPQLNLAAPQGTLALTLPYRFAMPGARPELTLEHASARLDGFALATAASRLQLRQLALDGVQFDLQQRRLTLGKVQLSGLALSAQRNRDGVLDWQAALPPPAPAAAVTTAAAGQTPGWRISVPSLRLLDSQASVQDQGFIKPLTVALALPEAQAALAVDEHGALSVSGAQLALRDIRASSGGAPWLSLAGVTLAASRFDLGRRQLAPGTVTLDGLTLQLQRDRAGRVNLQQLLARHPAGHSVAAAPAAAGKPWQISEPLLQLHGGRVDWQDLSTASPVRLALSALEASLTPQGDGSRALTLAAALGGGRLQADLQLPATLDGVNGKVKLDNLALPPLAPYALQRTVLALRSGALSADLALQLSGARWQVDGSAGVARLALFEPGQSAPLLGWQTLQLSGISANARKVRLRDVRLVSPQVRLILDAQRVPNFSRLFKPDTAGTATTPATATPAAAATPAPAKAVPARAAAATGPLVEIQAVRVRSGRLDFADQGMQPGFATQIHDLSGSVLGLSTASGRRGTVTLDGEVGSFGDVRIRGSLAPQAVTDDLDLALAFRNIPLSSLNPYATHFAGWKINDGRLTLDLRYTLQQRQLKGDNRLVIEHIELGDEIADYPGSRLPLRLAVALLEDSDGRIDLGLPVSGSLDDPQFSYGHLVWQAFKNILTKIATAPFRALMGDSGFDAVYADVGDGRLAPPEREKLQGLATLLQKRPKMTLQLGGSYDAAQDAPALARHQVDRDLLLRAAYPVPADEPLPLPDLGEPLIRSAVNKAYAARFGQLALLKIIATQADGVPRAQAMRQALIAAQPVDAAALQALGNSRAEAARQVLLVQHPELAARIKLLPADKASADKDGVPLMLKPG